MANDNPGTGPGIPAFRAKALKSLREANDDLDTVRRGKSHAPFDPVDVRKIAERENFTQNHGPRR